MSRRPLLTFFALAFALPWTVWATALAEQAGWTSWRLPGALAFWIGLPLASFGTAALTGGRAAVGELLARMVRVRVGTGWYAAALLTTPVLAALAAGAASVARLGVRPEFAGAAQLAGMFAFNTWMWLLTEETAWRGFALPRMAPRFGALGANLLLGLIWAAWHLPLFLIEGSFQSRLPFAAFALSTAATSLLIGWVFDGARGSVLVAALFHASADVTIAVSGVMTSGGGILWMFVGLQLGASVVAGARLASVSREKERSATMEPCNVVSPPS